MNGGEEEYLTPISITEGVTMNLKRINDIYLNREI